MISNPVLLFEDVCTIIFKFADGTTLRTTTTLNPEILATYGVQNLDGLVDLESRKLIPDEYFDLEFEFLPGIVPLASPLDTLLNKGGKTSW